MWICLNLLYLHTQQLIFRHHAQMALMQGKFWSPFLQELWPFVIISCKLLISVLTALFASDCHKHKRYYVQRVLKKGIFQHLFIMHYLQKQANTYGSFPCCLSVHLSKCLSHFMLAASEGDIWKFFLQELCPFVISSCRYWTQDTCIPHKSL